MHIQNVYNNIVNIYNIYIKIIALTLVLSFHPARFLPRCSTKEPCKLRHGARDLVGNNGATGDTTEPETAVDHITITSFFQ